MNTYRILWTAVATLWGAAVVAAEIPVSLSVEVGQPGHAVSPLLHGVFFEDINYAADGGLYAELVQNRSFEHADPFVAWGMVNRGGDGHLTIETADSLNAKNPHYARLTVRDPGKGFGLANYGFGGMPIKAGDDYILSVRVRGPANSVLLASLEDETGRTLATTKLPGVETRWKKLELSIKASGAATDARLVVLATAPGRTDLDVISLFPKQTFKQRRNGLRADLAQKIADLKPAFMRFPGGCIVEGKDLANRYQWKDTIGDIAERRQNWNRWQDAIETHSAPQYYQTYGLGFLEYFQFIEDIGAEPVPIVNVGMACQYQSKELAPLDKLNPYVQDALDLIEFANGAVTSTWGAKRAALGHPAPFNLKYIGIGNEQWGEEYFERYQVFAKAIQAKYPDIHLVSGSGPGVDDQSWQLAWRKFSSGVPANVVDEHYYRPPQWFLENASRYDLPYRNCPVEKTGSPAGGSCPKVFAGEFAAHDTRERKPSLRAAIAEAAFMTGLLRNSDHVVMSSYAPLLARAGATQWTPDLIWFDNTRVYGTASYYVQALYSHNRPDVILPVKVEGTPVSMDLLPPRAVATHGAEPLPPFKPEFIPTLYAAAGLDQRERETVVFLANPFAEPRAATIELRGAGALAPEARAFVLTSDNPDDANSFESPTHVTPREERQALSGATFKRTLAPYSFTVLRIRQR